MISTPQILQTKADAAAVIPLTVPRSDMMKVFGPAVGELMAVLAKQGVAATSAVFAHHLTFPLGAFNFELGVKVAKPVTSDGRVKPGQLPALKIARAIYSGPYEGLPSAWEEFTIWLKANGHEQAESLWEVYSVGPQSSANPADWRTELNRPLKG